MTHAKQEKHTVPNQMERISCVRKFVASRERINKRQGTPKQVQRETCTETKDKHSSIAGATGP